MELKLYSTPKHFIVIVRLGGDEDIKTRIKNTVPKVEEVLKQYCPGEYQPAFTSRDGSLIAYFIKTTTHIEEIRGALNGSRWDDPNPSILFDDDFFLAIEIYKNSFAGWGEHINKGCYWLQHH